MEKILVSFEQGGKGLIAKSTSDNGAWIVPGRSEKHQITPAIGKFLVEITGQTKNECLRFCKVLATLQSLVDDFIASGQADYTEITGQGSVHIAKHIAEGINLFMICSEKDGAIFHIKFCAGLNWADTIGGDLICRYDSPLPAQELPAQSRLNQAVITARAKFDETEKAKERARAERAQVARTFAEQAAQNPNDKIFAPLRALIERAKELEKQSGHVIWPKDDELGDFAKFETSGLDSITQTLSGDVVHVSYSWSSSSGGGTYFYCVVPDEYLAEQKELFLQEHPEFAVEKNSADFWTKAVRKYGSYEGSTEEQIGYGYCQDKHHYKLRVGDYFLSRTFNGGIGDEGPIYL
ncbi:hypothetical protein COU01_03190 [Candidatus Falkowbacteria bacterium CG10_big_fil_rev_8_21_14_0_10_44_15]|uniref:Uncharacterized protein n=1 Tax=Candidatus Falkowbacteria bacterium CG10_big_fil_rev_8_21_14_0_10_44_15 TaxID=1974569 RepID=A0A2H0UZB3_9BACT|nr:MAG: hypothetical protein COU01_03190 [Candidatus Falkowbacteria bacterium CG10_big_fil_rev_8_21_14_0_10_44_15]